MAFSEEEDEDEVASSSSNVEGLEDDTPDKAMLLGTGRELPTQADNFDIASTSRDESEEGGGKLPSDDDCSSDTEVVPDNECNSSTRVHSSSSIQKEPSQKLEDSISNAKGWWAVSSEEKEEKGQYAGWMAAKKGAYQEISEPLKIGCKQGSNDAMVKPEALPCESSLKEFSNLSISGHGSQRQSISLGKPRGIISNTFNRIADDVVATCIDDKGRDQHLNHIRLGIDLNLNDEGCQSVRNLYSISNAELEASQSSPTESDEGIEEMNVDAVASKHHQEEDRSMHFSLSGRGKGTPPLSLKESVLDTSSVGSQDPGEESQDDALNVVEKILWLNASAMSQNVGLQMARADQRSVQAGKGVRAVARTMETQMRKVQLSVYDWVGSEEDEDAYSMDKEGEEAAVLCEKKQEISNGMQTRHSKLPLDSKKEYENGTCMVASSDPSPNSKTARPEVAVGRGTRKRFDPHINQLQHDIEERAQNIEDVLSSSDEMINGSEEQPRSLGTNVNQPGESVIEQSLRGVVGQKSVTGNLQKMTLRHDLSSDRNLTSPERISEVKIHWGIVYNRRKRTPRINRRSITLINNADNFGMAESIACNSKMGRQVKTGGSAAQYPFALLVVFVLGGFIVSRNDIPKWWIWGYWISPMQYAENAIAVNEFLDPRWSMILANATESIGVTVIKSRGLFARGYWFWIGLAAMLGFGFIFNILSTLALSYLDPIEKPNTSISEEDYKKKKANSLEGSSKPPQDYRGPGSTPLIQLSGVSNLHSQDGGVAPQEVDIREAKATSSKGMVLPFQPLSMSFDQLNYYVAMPPEMKNEGVTEDRLQLLQNVSGCFRPGVLTALMGVSGAGKTTLMDVLAGRKTGGWIEGDIRISGYPKQQKTFARIAGYCEQNDIHSPHVTVEESLIFSAWLRLSSDIDSRTRKMFVEEVMELVELDNLRGAIVGIPGVSGLSTEQRKRLTIAVELVANPSLIFMDEPTSGLDARAAAIVMRAVRNTVNTGRTVVCTIHQPSIDIFETFDELLLLKRGGQTIYAGPLGTQSCHLIEYFQGIPGVPEIKEDINPAAWMLDVTSISHETRLQVDFAEIYQNSDLNRRTKDLIQDLSTPVPNSKELSFPTTYAQPCLTQTLACLWKQNRSYWRNPLYNVVRTFFTAITAFIFGSIFWDMGMKRGNQQDIFNILGSMYAAVLFLGALNNATGVQPVTSVERTVYYREKAAGMYSALPYSLGQMFVEIPYVLLQAVLYTVIVYPMIGFEWAAAKVFWFLFFSFFTFLYFTYFGMMTVALTPNFETAAILNGAFLVIWNLFAGFLIPHPSIPVWWRWYYWGTPLAWTLYGFCGSQLSDVTEQMSGGVAVKDFLEQYFGFHYDMLPVVAVMHLVFTLVFAFMFAFSIKHLNFQRR